MSEMTAQRTLVKSPPELWSELSDAETLARRLEPLGEIRITRVEPETTVAWEGEELCGTVEIEPSGWGTRVTLTARAVSEETVESQAVTVPEPEPEPEPDLDLAPRLTPEPPPAAPAPEPVARSPLLPPPLPSASRRRLFDRLFPIRVPRLEAPVEAPPQPLTPVPEPDEPAPDVTPTPLEPLEPAEPLEPDPEQPSEPPFEPPFEPAAGGEQTRTMLESVLDDLGSAHHRPFSRG